MQFLIVDDDFGSRGGMLQTLRDDHPSAVFHEAVSLAEAMRTLETQRSVDLVLLDLNIADSRGLDTLRRLKQWCETAECNPRIIVVSAAADYDPGLISEAIESCATGFIVKGTPVDVFRSAIQLTIAGSIYIPERYLQTRRRVAQRPQAGADEPNFTNRERQVAALLVQGLTYKQIARRLAEPGKPMSDNTVRVHVQRIAWKLRVTDEVEGDNLAAKAAVLTAFAERKLRFATGQ